MDHPLHFMGTSTGGDKGFLEELASLQHKVTLWQVLAQLRKTYCGTLAVEYMHINDPVQCNWILERVENLYWLKYDK
jgi:2-oxoglutarate dehydrogenase complex dehydrogenase (E1) component-like enzyme